MVTADLLGGVGVGAGVVNRRRRWSRQDVHELIRLVEQGYSDIRIGALLNRHPQTVGTKVKRLGLRRRNNVYPLRTVALLMGVHEARVLHWIRNGLLHGRKPGRGRQALWAIRQEWLFAFIENPDTWMLWDVADITDGLLREWATEVRQNGPRWLTAREVAERLRVAPATVKGWCARGYLPGKNIYTRWWIRECDLDSFVLPSERSRVRTQEVGA